MRLNIVLQNFAPEVVQFLKTNLPDDSNYEIVVSTIEETRLPTDRYVLSNNYSVSSPQTCLPQTSSPQIHYYFSETTVAEEQEKLTNFSKFYHNFVNTKLEENTKLKSYGQQLKELPHVIARTFTTQVLPEAKQLVTEVTRGLVKEGAAVISGQDRNALFSGAQYKNKAKMEFMAAGGAALLSIGVGFLSTWVAGFIALVAVLLAAVAIYHLMQANKSDEPSNNFTAVIPTA